MNDVGAGMEGDPPLLSSLSSRLLLWPRRRRRPRESTGWVVGWKQRTPLPSGRERETAICAGILSPSESLETYRRRIRKLRDHASESKPKFCACHLENLDVIALWTASASSPNSLPDRKNQTTQQASGLEVIAQRKQGYPWWVQQEGDSSSHRQVVFYDPPGADPANAHAHFSSELGQASPGSEWSMLVDKLNHAQSITRALQTSSLSDEPDASYHPQPDEESRTLENKSFPSNICNFILRNSMTLVHLRQLLHEERGQPQGLAWLSFISFIRCFGQKPTDSSRSLQFCRNCGKPALFVDRQQAAREYVSKWNHFLQVVIDLSLGIGAALLLLLAWRFSNPTTSLWAYYASMRLKSLDLLTTCVHYLETFPVGFKLNVLLTQKMGHGIRLIFSHHRRWLESTLWNASFVRSYMLPLLIVISGLCGWGSLLAVIIDLWRIENLHLWFLTVSIRHVYQIQLFLLAALFRLFLGKKRNVLRQRTDSMQYDAMQLLVGTIGFCICIFLWTTIMVYYTFFVATHLILNLPIVVLWLMYVASKAVPWGSLGWRVLRPTWFAQDLHLENLSNDGNPILVARICSTSESPLKLLGSSLKHHLVPLMSWLLGVLSCIIYPRDGDDVPASLPIERLMSGFR